MVPHYPTKSRGRQGGFEANRETRIDQRANRIQDPCIQRGESFDSQY